MHHSSGEPARRSIAKHARKQMSHRVAQAVAVTLFAVVTFGGSAFGFFVLRMASNVTVLASVRDLVGTPGVEEEGVDDALEGRAVNLLVLGSDSRSGENADIGGEDDGGMRSDTTLIVHLSADRTRVDVVSIPRDTIVTIPPCHKDWDPNGDMSRAWTTKFNAAYGVGGKDTGDVALAALCTATTVHEVTGLTMDGFAIVDMAGFEDMTEAVGGVQVCVPKRLYDTGGYTELDLDAGWHNLLGAEALDYVRARHVSGTDGTDPARIERQQRFVGALVRKVLSSDVLTSPTSLMGFLDAGTSSLTVSSELGGPTILGLAWGLRGLDSSGVTFLTAPWVYPDDDSGGVVLTAEADEVWGRLLADEPISTPEPTPIPDPSATAGTDTTGADPGGPTAPSAAPTPDPTSTASTPLPDLGLDVHTADDPDEVLCGAPPPA